MIVQISWIGSHFSLWHFSLFDYHFILFQESFGFLNKFLMFLLLSWEFSLDLWLSFGLAGTWVHGTSWLAWSPRRYLSSTKLLSITSSWCHTAEWGCDWLLILCPSWLWANLRHLSKMFFRNIFDNFVFFLITNLSVKTVYEINLIFLFLWQIFFGLFSFCCRFW